MLQNGGSSGAAGALQQEMNSDIRAMDLGALLHPGKLWHWEEKWPMSLPRKTQLWTKSIYDPLKMAQADAQYIFTAFIAAFSNYLLIEAFQVIHC